MIPGRMENKHIVVSTQGNRDVLDNSKNKQCTTEILNDMDDISGIKCDKSQAQKGTICVEWLTHRTFKND